MQVSATQLKTKVSLRIKPKKQNKSTTKRDAKNFIRRSQPFSG